MKRLETLQKLYEGVEGANIENELTADLIGDYLFTDSDFVNRLSTEKPGLFKRIFEEIKYLVKTATAGSKQARELEKVKRTFEKAYRESGTTANADGKTKYSINSKFYEQLDSWDGKTEGFAFVVGETSEALQKAGIPRKQIRWDASKIATLLKKHSGMTRETVKGIPELLENPVIVVDSKKGDNSKIVMGELYDENGKVVTAVLLLTPTSKKGNVLDLVKISSAEGRSHINSLFTKEDGTPVEVRYVDKKRIQNWLNVNRLQLPLHNHIMDSNDIIPQIEENASGKQKYSVSDSAGRQLSEGQREYFKDSKVRDENGALKPVYHGTKAEFTKFDISKNRVITFGNGFYFGENQEAVNMHYAGDGGRVMEVYLDIKNPFVIEQSQLKDIDSVPDVIMEMLDVEGVTKYNINQVLKEHGYDGIHYRNKGNDVYVAYSPEQVKSVDNQNPTKNKDINLSLSETSFDIAPPIGNNVYGKDIALDLPIRNDLPQAGEIAPVQQQKITRENLGPVRKDITPVEQAAEKKPPISQQAIKRSYKQSEDKSFCRFVVDALAGELHGKSFHKLSQKISSKMANDIESLVGFSVEGYSNEIAQHYVKHIDIRHGANGEADHSMENLHDVAGMGYVIGYYDKMVKGHLEREYKNSDGSPAQTVVLQKKIDDNYYYVVDSN
ncbi:MAG: hypothetical protein IKB07_10420 [Lachnospiraceae bacterium]|nr:hypothetical protein [Lachnospiraceae bacterium]